MRLDVLIALSLGSTLALAGTVLGQQPAPSTSPPTPPPADYGAPITNEQAKEKYPAGWKSPKPYIRIVPQPTN